MVAADLVALPLIVAALLLVGCAAVVWQAVAP